MAMVVDPKLLQDHEIPQSVYDDALRVFHRSYRPVYLGELSAEIGWSVERTEQVVAALVESGSVRHATDAEKLAIDAPKSANLYALVGERDVSLAHKE